MQSFKCNSFGNLKKLLYLVSTGLLDKILKGDHTRTSPIQSSLNCFGSMPMVPDLQSQPNLHIFGKTYNIQYVVPFI